LASPGGNDAYTEQDAHFVNLEGKIQKAYQASFKVSFFFLISK
jgi:hypothetical protein